MTHRNVEEDILTRLDRFVKSGDQLPATNDGKVNVKKLCEALGLPTSDTQHFHRKDAIKLAVNALAHHQNLLLIGARGELAAADKVVRARIITTASQAKEDAQAATEAKAQYSAVLDELRAANDELERLRLENSSLKAQIEMIHNGVMLRI